MFQLIHDSVRVLEPVLAPICFLFAWSFLIVLGWSLWSAIADVTARAKEMHQIPCTKCQFFTNDYRLKCTVMPSIANTEKAIDCIDYRSRNHGY